LEEPLNALLEIQYKAGEKRDVNLPTSESARPWRDSKIKSWTI